MYLDLHNLVLAAAIAVSAGATSAGTPERGQTPELQRILARFGGPRRDAPTTRPSQERPAEARRAALQAAALEATGDVTQAARLYTTAIELAEGSGDVALLARRRLVRLMLDSPGFATPQVQEQLEAVRASGAPLDPELWALQCRLVLRQVLESPDGQRAQIWKGGLGLLRGVERPYLDVQGQQDLDRLLEALKDAQLADEILADLVLLFPEPATVSALQRRRAALFARRNAWEDAQAAADLSVLAASLSREGPLPASADARQTLGVPGAPPDLAMGPARWGGGGSGRPAVDSVLRSAAQQTSGANGQVVSPRRKALMLAFAGDAAGAAREIHAALSPALSVGDPAGQTLDDVAILLAVTDGSFRDPFRLARWLCSPHPPRPAPATAATTQSDVLLAALVQHLAAEDATIVRTAVASTQEAGTANAAQAARRPDRPYSHPRTQRAETAGRWADQWEQRLVQWGREALGSADPDWALALWAAAANARPGAGEHLQLLPQVFEAAGANKPPEQADPSLQILAQLVPRLSSADDRYAVHAKIAAIRLERGEFQTAIEELDRAGSGSETMAAGFTRALSLIRLDKSDEAMAVLEKMEKMPGSEEERARAAFLIGWMHLRADDRPKASAVFERVVDRYPRTTSAKKAKELLPPLQAGLP